MNEYLAIDSDEYLCTNSLGTLTAAGLDVSCRCRDGVQLNRSVSE